jgi:glutathione S-transferase
MTSLPLTSLITLLVLLVFFGTAVNVGKARGKYGIKAPAVTGHEMFDRAFRIQMNTLEGMALMLPALWVCAAFRGDTLAGVLGLVWVIARIWYAVGYLSDPSKREGGFILSLLAFAGLLLTGLWGVIGVLMAAPT